MWTTISQKVRAIEWSFLYYTTFWTSLGWRHQKFPQNNSSGFVVIGSGSKPANESWNTGRTDNSLRVTWIHKLYPSLLFRAAHTTPSVACLSPWSSVRQAFSCSLRRREWSLRRRFPFRFSLKTPNWTFLQLSILPWYIYISFSLLLLCYKYFMLGFTNVFYNMATQNIGRNVGQENDRFLSWSWSWFSEKYYNAAKYS